MSVIEFIQTYWDWYLTFGIGLTTYLFTAADLGREHRPLAMFIAFIGVLILWPLFLCWRSTK